MLNVVMLCVAFLKLLMVGEYHYAECRLLKLLF
jgi:hypothetical protein